MTDHVSPEKRSWLMSRVKSKNTAPELIVRRLLHGLGYRFRLHVKELPGKPDIVLPKYKTVIFVHGCFWHNHKGCKKATGSKTRAEFWQNKFDNNVARFEQVASLLKKLGWRVGVVWQCETKNLNCLSSQLQNIIQESVITGND